MYENGGKVKEGKSGFVGVERTKGSGFGLGALGEICFLCGFLTPFLSKRGLSCAILIDFVTLFNLWG